MFNKFEEQQYVTSPSSNLLFILIRKCPSAHSGTTELGPVPSVGNPRALRRDYKQTKHDLLLNYHMH